jgi:hypothetical protein
MFTLGVLSGPSISVWTWVPSRLAIVVKTGGDDGTDGHDLGTAVAKATKSVQLQHGCPASVWPIYQQGRFGVELGECIDDVQRRQNRPGSCGGGKIHNVLSRE